MVGSIAIICGGGGLKGGFIAGCLDELNKLYPLCQAKYVAATSASVGSIFHYVCYGDAHIGERVWTETLNDPRFLIPKIGFRFLSGKNLINLDAMIGIFKENNLFQRQLNSPPSFPIIVPLHHIETRQVRYLRYESSKLSEIEMNKLIKASKSAPILCDTYEEIEGDLYADAAISEPWFQKYKADEKLIFVVTREDYVPFYIHALHGVFGLIAAMQRLIGLRPLPMYMYLAFLRTWFDQEKAFKRILDMEKSGQAIVLNPSKTLSSSVRGLKENYEAGRERVLLDVERIRKFVENTK